MRIIAGEHRGRRLLGPVDASKTRPITDRVKTALFDRLAARDMLIGAKVLDCFAGTGSLGIECLSRGADRVIFVERDRTARQRLEQNLEMIRAGDQALILENALTSMLIEQLRREGPIDLLFVDPPYAMLTGGDAPKVVHQIEAMADVAADDAWLIVRTATQTPPPQLQAWPAVTSHSYGSMTIHIYQRDAEAG